jgi:hypothetical protein
MTQGEFMLTLFGCLAIAPVAMWLGRKWQRHHWMLDRPYSERLEAIRSKRG